MMILVMITTLITTMISKSVWYSWVREGRPRCPLRVSVYSVCLRVGRQCNLHVWVECALMAIALVGGPDGWSGVWWVLSRQRRQIVQ